MWQTVKISDVCTIKGRIGYRGYTKGDLVESGEGAISLSPSNIISNKINFTKSTYISWEKYYESPEIMLDIDDIVFCKTASIGKLAIVEDLPVETTLNPQFVVLKNISCDNRFLYYAIQSPSFSSQISGIIGGTAIPTLSQKNLGELVISLPPLAEQQRIVAKLDAAFAEVDSAIESAVTKETEVEKLKDSLLSSSLDSNSVMCKTVKLGDVCKINNGGTPKSGVKSYWEGDVKWLTPKDMGKLVSRYVSSSERQITQDGLDNSSAKLVPSQSIILSCRAPIGHVFINEVEMSFNQGCKGLITTNEITVEYLYYFLFSSKKLLNDLGTGTTFKEISGKTLANVSISLPPLAEQKRIVVKLDAAFAEIENANKAIIKSKANYLALKSAILAQELQSEVA